MQTIRTKKKKVIIFICILILLKVLSSFLYQSAYDEKRIWRTTSYCYIFDNPYHVWDGILYYYGKNAPEKIEVKLTGDEHFYECEDFGIIDKGTDEKTNATRILLNLFSFHIPSAHGYVFLAEGDRLKNEKIEIRWEENGEKHQSVIEIKK